MLLDCGLFQGLKPLRLRNWSKPAFAPEEIDGVLLTHAHIDHSGYLPLLARRGFRKPIWCTPATADLLRVMLLDAAHLQEEEAEVANRYGYSKHHPALPLYLTEDAETALGLVRTIRHGERFTVGPGLVATFHRVGHILGAAAVEVEIDDGTRLVYSGDLGRWNQPILRDPELVPDADVLLVESTYGDRTHGVEPEKALARVVRDAAARGGALIIPAFAVGRTQELIWRLRQLEDAGQIPSLPVFVDSPMAIDVTDIYCRHPEEHDLEMRDLMDRERCPLCCRKSHLVRSVAESKALNDRRGPMIVIAGSGMATGGRVIHHLKVRLPDRRTTVLLAGYQAAGTRGRSLQQGAATIRIHGQDVPVRAQVETIDGLSAHADRNDILRWLGGFRREPRQTWVVHGEPGPASALAETIRKRLRWTVGVAADGETVPLR